MLKPGGRAIMSFSNRQGFLLGGGFVLGGSDSKGGPTLRALAKPLVVLWVRNCWAKDFNPQPPPQTPWLEVLGGWTPAATERACTATWQARPLSDPAARPQPAPPGASPQRPSRSGRRRGTRVSAPRAPAPAHGGLPAPDRAPPHPPLPPKRPQPKPSKSPRAPPPTTPRPRPRLDRGQLLPLLSARRLRRPHRARHHPEARALCRRGGPHVRGHRDKGLG